MLVEGPRVWKTKNGTLVEVSEMSDSHLVNTVRYLLRREAERLELLGLATQARSCQEAIQNPESGLRTELRLAAFAVGMKFVAQSLKSMPLREVEQFPWMVAEMSKRKMWILLMKLQREFGSLLYMQKIGRLENGYADLD